MVKRKSREGGGRGAKRRCGPKISDKGDIDTNVCCTCNGLYEHDVIEGTGADWLACACVDDGSMKTVSRIASRMKGRSVFVRSVSTALLLDCV